MVRNASLPTRLTFIRHAETALAGTFCGRTDPPLNACGLAQLPALLERLAAIPLEAVYSSNSLRARQTAEAIASARAVPLHLRPALAEIDFGAWEALSWESIEQRDKLYAARWVAEFPNLPAPEGEAIPQFKFRVLNEIASLRAEAASHNIAVVTHAGVLRVLLEEVGHLAPHHAWERTRDYTCTIRCTQTSATSHLEIHP